MAARYRSLEEIRICIIFDAPDNSNDLIQSWEEDSDEEISDPDEAEDVQNPDSGDDFGNEMPLTAEIRVHTQNQNPKSGYHWMKFVMLPTQIFHTTLMSTQSLLSSLIGCLQMNSGIYLSLKQTGMRGRPMSIIG